MKPIALKLFTAMTSFGVASGVAWFCAIPRLNGAESRQRVATYDPNEEVDCGTQICARCGAKREVFRKGQDELRFVPTSTIEETWSVKRIGECSEHSWQHTGCFDFGLTGNADEHPLWKALLVLRDVDHADEFARRFASLSNERQIELWRYSQRLRLDRPSDVARLAAADAGWPDLAACWPE